MDRVRLGLREMAPWMDVLVAERPASLAQLVSKPGQEKHVERVHLDLRVTALWMGVTRPKVHVAERSASLAPIAFDPRREKSADRVQSDSPVMEWNV